MSFNPTWGMVSPVIDHDLKSAKFGNVNNRKAWSTRELIAIGLFLLSSLVSSGQEQGDRRPLGLIWTENLHNVGWTPALPLKNREFFEQIGSGNFGSTDTVMRLAFIADECVAAYQTKQIGDYKSSSYELESFFIDAGSGKLIKKEKWATTGRTWTDDRLDGLNRIIPLGQDRFAVVISRSIETFDMRFRPLKVYALDPPPTKWAVQAVNDGAELAIRHESVRPYSVRFSWFSADSLQPIGGFKDLDLKMLGGPTAGDRVLFIGGKRGIRQLGIDQQEKTICDSSQCDGRVASIGGNLLGFLGDSIGVIAMDRGVLWRKAFPRPGYNRTGPDVLSSDLKSSRHGERVAFYLTADRQIKFLDTVLSKQPTLFVFDSSSGNLLFSISYKVGYWHDFALSPSGDKLALFDGKNLSVFKLPK